MKCKSAVFIYNSMTGISTTDILQQYQTCQHTYGSLPLPSSPQLAPTIALSLQKPSLDSQFCIINKHVLIFIKNRLNLLSNIFFNLLWSTTYKVLRSRTFCKSSRLIPNIGSLAILSIRSFLPPCCLTTAAASIESSLILS